MKPRSPPSRSPPPSRSRPRATTTALQLGKRRPSAPQAACSQGHHQRRRPVAEQQVASRRRGRQVALWNLATGERISLDQAGWADYERRSPRRLLARCDQFVAGGAADHEPLGDRTGDRIKRFPGLGLPISCVRVGGEGQIPRDHAADRASRHQLSHHRSLGREDGQPISQFNIAVESSRAASPQTAAANASSSAAAPAMDGHLEPARRPLPVRVRAFSRHAIVASVSPHNNRLLAALDTAGAVFGLETS